ncbi:MAG: T9SS type A sorting domain-containing protein [Candidatus Syntrophosphaera sp.]|nr:T9SS type A sorting domain-containing protein [Candidatus Syntrophosphaera sp.]
MNVNSVLFLSLETPDGPIVSVLKGVEAIRSGDPSLDRNIGPFTDKAVEYAAGDRHFWIVASNYAGCEGVEGLTANRVMLYDYKGHFYRIYNPATQSIDIMRNAMFKPAGSSHAWSFLLFAEKPVLPDLNRWPGNNRAALCLTSEADSQTLPRLKAVFEGSDNPANPKYLTQGFFARGIPVSQTVFGCDQPSLGQMWQTLLDHGNTIGYHTFAPGGDPPGATQQAILEDLVPYGIRLWTENAAPTNPEALAHAGLDPDSQHYLGDVIDQGGIDYLWNGDFPASNPFNAYAEPWRLPHLVYETPALSRPVWWFGPTRMPVWEYLSSTPMLGMKYLLTPDNLDDLISKRGLMIGNVILCAPNLPTQLGFHQIAPNGDLEVRDEVDELLVTLDLYRRQRGLWIATPEDVFDRLLALERVRVESVQPAGDPRFLMVTLHNGADRDINDLGLELPGRRAILPLLAAGASQSLWVSRDTDTPLPQVPYQISFREGSLLLRQSDGLPLEPLRLEIFNLRGQKVCSQLFSAPQNQFALPFAGKASGIYFAQINTLAGAGALLRFTVLK